MSVRQQGTDDGQLLSCGRLCLAASLALLAVSLRSMSLQPCLPLPPSCSSSRSRRCRGGRKRKHPPDPGRHGRDGDECGHSDDDDDDDDRMPPTTIASAAGMSALDFLGRVHEESRRLGDVFVAEGAEGGAAALAFARANGPANANDANARTLTCTSRRSAGNQPGEEEAEEEEEGEISDKDTRTHTACKEREKTKRKDCYDDDPKSQTERPTRPLSCHAAAAATTRPCSSTDGATNGKRSGSNLGITGSLAYLLSDRAGLPPPPSAAHLPTSASVHAGSPTPASASSASVWADVAIDDFSKLRLYLDACVQGNVGGKRSGTRMAVPPMRARDGWHAFCLGKEEARGCCRDDDDDDDDSGDTDKPLEPWEANIPATGHPPSTALLCQMDQVMVRRVLVHHIAYLCDGGGGGSSSPEDDHRRRYMYHRTRSAHAYAMTTNRARWVYGLLARLAKPLHRDDAAAVRQLLRECCVRRAGLDAKNGARAGREVSLLNTLIAITGIYFEQGNADALFPCL